MARNVGRLLGNHDPTVETFQQWEVRIQPAFNNKMAALLDDPTVAMVQDSILQAAGSVIPTKPLEMQKCYMQCRMCKPADMKI